MSRLVFVCCLILITFGAVQSQTRGQTSHLTESDSGQTGPGLFLPENIKWQPGPSSLLPGTKMAILEGDPSKEGLFTMRLWLPDGFDVLPHWHTQIEHVTVIKGILNFGMGEKFDRAATTPMTAGSFGFWPPGMRHFAWTKGETVLQLHGKGPWTVTYVNPSDDPRIRKQ
ncbi:MAG TPA: cupin domain-containing protein [Blastocatellia bacterium]|nr:cupin domain-containing protein [Blastocatellia bacterium]